MGVRSFSSFINDNASTLLVSQELKDTSLIIDGYNILHELYYFSPANTTYGGDYDIFSKSIETFCKRLSINNINPFFVFDGASELHDLKFHTGLERAQERIHLANLSSHRKRTKILPCLAFRACIDKLRELNVPFCVCDHEADQQLASLAREWNCPLVSNDTDFLLFDLPGGVISVQNLNLPDILDKSASADDKLYARIYHNRTLLELYDIKPRNLPLLAVICGNDSFPSNKMIRFRRHINRSKSDSMDIAKYLRWLANYATLDCAVTALMLLCGPIDKDRQRSRVMKTVEAYNSYTNHVGPYFLTGKIMHTSTHRLHETLPELFWSRYRSALISKRLMEVLFFHRRVFAVQMEDLKCPSAWLSSACIRQQTYQILSASSMRSITTVSEYDRHNKLLLKRVVPVNYNVPRECITLETLYDQSVEQRLNLFYKTLEITDEMVAAGVVTPDSPDRKDNDILTALIIFWVNHCEPQSCKIHLMSILVCVVNLSLIDEHLSKQDRVCKQVERHSHVPTRDQRHELGLEMPVLQAMAQFQSVLSDGLDLLGLLGIDFNIRLHEIFSGRYVYNLAIELSARIDPGPYCEELLVRGSDYSNLFKSWYQLIEENVKEGYLTVMGNNKVTAETISKAAKKRAKRAAQRNRSASPVDVEAEEKEEVTVEELLDNRFALLSIVKD
ncbi:single-strand DNA endonuclease ASTE1-like [Watersipora subatra]|uniref:single-strand DNA endonuclease ASTE1-like n=1 Tax=Watersipora subatra TaxID=2589382 RepID=UPI00355B7604